MTLVAAARVYRVWPVAGFRPTTVPDGFVANRWPPVPPPWSPRWTVQAPGRLQAGAPLARSLATRAGLARSQRADITRPAMTATAPDPQAVNLSQTAAPLERRRTDTTPPASCESPAAATKAPETTI